MLDAKQRSRQTLLSDAQGAGCRLVAMQLLEQAIDFIDNECEPRSAEAEATNRIPDDLLKRMREMGHFGFTMPREHGGHGLTSLEYVFICMAYGRSAVAFPLMMNINNGVGTRGVLYHGTPEQKKKYLRGLASGELIAAFCLTEPQAGSDAGGIQTTAIQKGTKWILNGTKHFITNSPIADFFIVFAVTDPKLKVRGGITAFLVDKENPGLKQGKEQLFLGAKGSPTGEIHLVDCEVDESMICGEIGHGFAVALQSIDYSRLTIGARHTHSAELLLQMSVDWAKSRRTFGKALEEHQAIQFKLADMATEIHLAKLLALDTAKKYDMGLGVNAECSMVKMYCMEMANRVVDSALQIHGGYGYSTALPIERFYRDLRGPRIWDGSMEMQRHVIAKRVLSGHVTNFAAAPTDILQDFAKA
ncbi:MAG: acyl-CoA dehydrogenase family protein [Polaromonas sp.]|nr:acyl-CoA dehydrogenase family protein [Polaromonas sp.]